MAGKWKINTLIERPYFIMCKYRPGAGPILICLWSYVSPLQGPLGSPVVCNRVAYSAIHQLLRKLHAFSSFVYVCDPVCLIARKYTHAYNGIYLLFCSCYSNSVSFIELLRIVASYMVKFVLKYCVQKKSY